MQKLLAICLAVLAMGTVAGCVVDDTYAICNRTADCNDLDDTCFEVAISGVSAGRFCSHTCIDDFDCEGNFGFAGACYGLGRPDEAPPLCFQTCIEDFDCYASSICIPVELPGRVLDFICVPDN